MKIKLICGHVVECESPDKAICEKCSNKPIQEEKITNPNEPEYLKIVNQIHSEFLKANPNIKQEIYQDENKNFNVRFIEPSKTFMRIFHSNSKYKFEIKNISKQPIQELKNILENVKAKSEKAKEFRSIFGQSSLRFIVDELFSNIYFDGKEFNFDVQCTKKRQYSYLGIALSILGGLLTLILV
jgi:hypothetical protein